MPINTGNQLEIAYKRLSGVVATNPTFGIGNEEIASSVQLGSYQIFGQQIATSPDDAVVSGVAAKTIFRIRPVPSSLIGGINYVWKLQKYDGAEWSDFSGQLIPFTFGQDYYPLLYKSGASSLVNSEEFGNININIGNQEDKNSAKNWFVDTFAGTLWFQDNTGDQITDEWFIIAYEYTGQYLDTVVGEGGGGGTSPLPTENTVHKPTGTDLGIADYYINTVPLPDTKKYFLLYGNPSAQGVQHPDGDHHVTQIKLKDLSSKYGAAKSKEIVIKNLGIDPDGGWSADARSTIEIEVAAEPSNPVAGENKLNGSYESFYLYTKGETVTLLWDGLEWHIV